MGALSRGQGRGLVQRGVGVGRRAGQTRRFVLNALFPVLGCVQGAWGGGVRLKNQFGEAHDVTLSRSPRPRVFIVTIDYS